MTGTSLPRPGPLAWVCLALVAVSVLVSAVNLGVQPFWVDEAGAVMPARSILRTGLPRVYSDFDFMPWQVKHGLWDPATPLYRYALAGFTAVTGFSEVTTRAFSLLAGLAAAVPFFALVRRVFGANTAWLASAFLLASPTYMAFAREARHYTFVLLWIHAVLFYLHAAAGSDERAKGLWLACLVAALLSQTLAYALLPVVGLFAVAMGPARLFARRWLPLYVGLGAVYLAVVAVFWDTLPFFHVTSCENRPAACQESLAYYPAVLLEFLRPVEDRWVRFPDGFFPLLPVSLLPFLFGAGVLATVAAFVRRPRERRGTGLVLLWLVVPFALLSANDVKFPRYLFQWTISLCALFPAVAVETVAGAAGRAAGRRVHAGVSIGLGLLVVAAPQVAVAPDGGLRLRSGLLVFVRDTLLHGPEDNFERMGWQVEQLAGRVRPGDAVVTTHDDASLQFYLDRPVYGFLSSRRTDAFFLELLARAEREGATVWFVDSLPRHDYCLSAEPEPRHVSCREKYAGFYAACREASGSPACRRLEVPRWVRRPAARQPSS